MGLLDWLRPSPTTRLARARDLLAQGSFAEARLDALELGDLAGAAEVVATAEEGLANLNLTAAVSWAEAGDLERTRLHLGLAEQYRTDGMVPAFADAKQRIEAMFAARQEAARAKGREAAQKLMQVDPRFKEVHAIDEIPLPPGLDEDEADAVKARLAILHDGFPEALRGRMIPLGAVFAQAVLDLDEGKTEAALQALLSLPDDEPLVLHERARAAHALGDPAAAARSWRAFATLAGGHHPIGNQHTALLLAHAEAETGRFAEAIQVLEEAGATTPALGAGLYAQLLEVTGKLGEAEATWRSVLKASGPHPAVYSALARVRLRGGHRMAAMQALETCLQEARCSNGKCGHVEPGVDVYRTLATLYLEDGSDRKRGLELAEEAQRRVREPAWEDAYLLALTARERGDSTYPMLVDRLREATPEGDPRRERVVKLLPGA